MSWDSYIDNLVAQSKDGAGNAHVDKGIIIGLDGGAAWTTQSQDNSLKLDPAEASEIANCFKSKKFESFQQNGVKVCGVKYQFLRQEDDKMVLAKKKDQGGLCIQASKTAIVIGHTPEGGQQGNTNKAVGVIAEYLESLNM